MKIIKLVILASTVTVAIIGAIFYAISCYQEYKVAHSIARIQPDLDLLLQYSVAYTSMYGHLPASDQLELNNLNLRYVYRIKNWASHPSHINTVMGQTGYIQGFINGPAIGLVPGTGGMFTCLLANRKVHVEAKCLYQIKQM